LLFYGLATVKTIASWGGKSNNDRVAHTLIFMYAPLPPLQQTGPMPRLWHFYGQGYYHYLHNNPVARGLVAHPGDWPWSSWRFYYREDRSLLAMDPPR